jgi:hypothetical protein
LAMAVCQVGQHQELLYGERMKRRFEENLRRFARAAFLSTMALSVVIVLGSIVRALFFFLGLQSSEIYSIAVGAFVGIASFLLFAYRTIYRLYYGYLEIAIGVVTAYEVAASGEQRGLAMWLAIAAACYVCVRGMDNIKQSKQDLKPLEAVLTKFMRVDRLHSGPDTYDTWLSDVTSKRDEDHGGEPLAITDTFEDDGTAYEISYVGRVVSEKGAIVSYSIRMVRTFLGYLTLRGGTWHRFTTETHVSRPSNMEVTS